MLEIQLFEWKFCHFFPCTHRLVSYFEFNVESTSKSFLFKKLSTMKKVYPSRGFGDSENFNQARNLLYFTTNSCCILRCNLSLWRTGKCQKIKLRDLKFPTVTTQSYDFLKFNFYYYSVITWDIMLIHINIIYRYLLFL